MVGVGKDENIKACKRPKFETFETSKKCDQQKMTKYLTKTENDNENEQDDKDSVKFGSSDIRYRDKDENMMDSRGKKK